MRKKHFWLLSPGDTGGSTPPPAGTGSGETPPVPASTGETPATATGETPGTTTTLSTGDAQKEVERLQAALKRANSEARTYREKATELDTLKKQIEEEKLSEKEKLEKRLAEAQKEREQAVLRGQEGIVNAEIRAELAAQGLKNPKLARLVDRERIEFDDNGNPINIAELIADVLKDMPELKPQAGSSQQRAAPTSGGATNPSRSQSGAPPVLTDEVIAKMTPQEYEARRAEIIAYRYAHPFRYGQRH